MPFTSLIIFIRLKAFCSSLIRELKIVFRGHIITAGEACRPRQRNTFYKPQKEDNLTEGYEIVSDLSQREIGGERVPARSTSAERKYTFGLQPPLRGDQPSAYEENFEFHLSFSVEFLHASV